MSCSKEIKMKSKLLLLVAGLLFSLNAFAMTLQDAKTAGYLGEQHNGYLGLVAPNGQAKALMLTVNAKRKAFYQKIATKNNISVEQVAKLAAQKAYNATEAGQYIQDSNGQWHQKQ